MAMRPIPAYCGLVLFSFLAVPQPPVAIGQEPDLDQIPRVAIVVDGDEARREAEAWFPPSTYAIASLAPSDTWLQHPLRQSVVQSEVFQKIWRSPNVVNARTGLAAAELAMGMKLEIFVQRIAAGGAYAAADRDTGGVVLLLRARDEKWLRRTFDKVLEFAKKDSESKGNPNRIKKAEYRGIQGYQVQEAIIGTIGPWLLITNKSDLAKVMIDRHLDKEPSALTDAAWKRPVPSSSSKQPVLSIDTDLETVRSIVPETERLRGPARDFGAELILGGILALAENAPSASFDLTLEDKSIVGVLSSPTDPTWFSQSREHFVGPEAKGRALPNLELPNAIASISAYRNLSELWLRAGDLFDQRVNDQLAQADSTLTTLFSGKDFGSDILGAIEPELRLVVVPQSLDASSLQPAIKLPGVALVGQLKDPKGMRRELKRIFQSFVGFLNIVGAMEGQPQLDLMSEDNGQHVVHWAEYVIDADRTYDNGLPIQYNFSPALAFVGDQVVLASTVALARQAEKVLQNEPALSKEGATEANTLLDVNAAAVLEALRPNTEAMIAQNMLEKGHSREEATQEINTLINVLEWIDRARLELSFATRSTLSLRLDLK